MSPRPLAREIAFLKSQLGQKTLVLIGMMGAGKTSLGRKLSARLDLPFFDADHEIEMASGKTINEIFVEHGEAYFREGERKVIARILEKGPQILATGGGAYMDASTRQAIKIKGISIWLKADFNLLMGRVMKRRTRPLLRADDPGKVMSDLMEHRYPIYEQADIVLISRDGQHRQMINELIYILLEKMIGRMSNESK